MKQSDDLFKLIKSLSKSEKRHFKLSNTPTKERGKKNVYFQLFEILDTQKEYSEDELLKILKKDIFSKKNLADVKDYLNTVVLRSLRNFHANRTVDMQLKHMLIDLEILFSKGLHSQFKKVLDRAKQLAYKY